MDCGLLNIILLTGRLCFFCSHHFAYFYITHKTLGLAPAKEFKLLVSGVFKMMFQPLNDPMPRQFPHTVEQVVAVLYEDISFRDKVIFANLSESVLDPFLYMVMAKTIREEFGLYNGNTELLVSCCKYIGRTYENHEDPVMVIIKELWKKAKKTHSLHLVGKTNQATAN